MQKLTATTHAKAKSVSKHAKSVSAPTHVNTEIKSTLTTAGTEFTNAMPVSINVQIVQHPLSIIYTIIILCTNVL